MAKPPRVEGVEQVYQGGLLRIFRATLSAPDGKTFARDIEDHGRAAAVLAYDAERRVALLVQQFRAAVNHVEPSAAVFLEPIAGLLDDDEPEVCARREGMEEAGLRLTAVEKVATCWSMPGISTEQITLFLAPYGAADRVASGGGLEDENEDISVVEMPLQDLAEMARGGGKIDMKLLVLVQALQLRRPDLFSA